MTEQSNTHILHQGAEARLFIDDYNSEKCLVKERFPKNYRHPELDKLLTKQRIRAECKAISRCQSANIPVARVLNMNLEERKIYLEYFPKSLTAKTFINNIVEKDIELSEKLLRLGTKIGEIVGQMHKNNIVHGDLTTSNMLINPSEMEDFEEYQLIMIDFGLSSYSQSAESKGVDLYVLERALISAHGNVPEFFSIIMESYKKYNDKGWKQVLTSFEEVRARGRKRMMVG